MYLKVNMTLDLIGFFFYIIIALRTDDENKNYKLRMK